MLFGDELIRFALNLLLRMLFSFMTRTGQEASRGWERERGEVRPCIGWQDKQSGLYTCLAAALNSDRRRRIFGFSKMQMLHLIVIANHSDTPNAEMPHVQVWPRS